MKTLTKKSFNQAKKELGLTDVSIYDIIRAQKEAATEIIRIADFFDKIEKLKGKNNV